MPKSLVKNKPNVNPNFIFVLAVTMLAVSSSYIFTISKKNHLIPRNAGINVVTIANENYDAVVCPTGSTDTTCTHFGAAGMQIVINNAPSRSKDAPYKVFIKNGEYTGFIPLSLSEINTEGKPATFYTFFNIKNKSIILKGESNELTIINGQDQNSTVFNVDDSDYAEFSNFRILNTKDLWFADATLDSTNGCKKTNSSICYSHTGSFVRTTSSTSSYVSHILIINIHAFKTVDFLYVIKSVKNSTFDIKNSVAHSMRVSGISAHGGSTINVVASEFIALSDPPSPYASMYFTDETLLNFKNSIVFWQNQQYGSCLHLYGNAVANITNSFFSNCINNGILLTTNSKAYINNSIVQSVNYYGVRANDTSSAEVKNSFIYLANQGITKGNVTLIQPPLNSNYTDDPQIVFSVSDYYNPNSFNLLAVSRSRNTGDPAILNVDGTRSHIGPAGGPDACLLRSYFPGCNLVSTPTPMATVSPTKVIAPSVTPTVTSIPSVNPSSPILYGDMDGNKMLNVNDILLLIKEVFK